MSLAKHPPVAQSWLPVPVEQGHAQNTRMPQPCVTVKLGRASESNTKSGVDHTPMLYSAQDDPKQTDPGSRPLARSASAGPAWPSVRLHRGDVRRARHAYTDRSRNIWQVDRGPLSSGMMRVLLINPNSSRATTDMMVSIARSTAPAAMEIVGATARRGPPMIVDPAALAASAIEVAEIGARLANDFAGVIISAFGDPGLAELRRELDIPVVGIAESAMLEAARGERRFGIATTTPALVAAVDAKVAGSGFAHLYTGVRLAPGDPLALVADPDRLIAALAD